MTTLQNIPFMIRAVPMMMVNILFLLSPYIFIITTIALIIKVKVVKGKRSEKDNREMIQYALMSVVSGVMFLIMYLYFQKNPLIF